MLRHDVGTTAADTRLLDLAERVWRGASAAVCALGARIRRRQRIRVRDVSEDWLACHESEAGKHRDTR